jgi:ligand-binding sensor domain-containing protein
MSEREELALLRLLTTMKSNIVILLVMIVALASCNGQSAHLQNSAKPTMRLTVVGDTVKELGSNIMVVYQDKNGVYWFGSWQTGIYRYDGRTLLNYSTKHGLAQNRIDEIKEDNSGNLYFNGCYPNSSISKFDGQTFSKLSAMPTDNWKLEPNDLWLKHAYQTEKVYRYDGTTLFELKLPKPPSLSNSFEIYCIYKDQQGSIWFGTNPSGVCRYNGTSFDWITEDDVTEFGAGGANGVRSIVEDVNGDFWFNTEFRYGIYDRKTIQSGRFYSRHESIGSLDSKKDSKIVEYLSIVKDNVNDLWMTTYRDGVWKYDEKVVTHYPIQFNQKDITVFSLYKDNYGDLWLGTHDNGVFKFNGTTFEKFNP